MTQTLIGGQEVCRNKRWLSSRIHLKALISKQCLFVCGNLMQDEDSPTATSFLDWKGGVDLVLML